MGCPAVASLVHAILSLRDIKIVGLLLLRRFYLDAIFHSVELNNLLDLHARLIEELVSLASSCATVSVSLFLRPLPAC